MDLAKLQNLCKREPGGYREDFLLQLQHFNTQLNLFKHHPEQSHTTFASLVNFLAHVAPIYPKDLKKFPQTLLDLLETHSHVLKSEMRMTLVKGLILLRNRNHVSAVRLIPVLFKLFRVQDKPLRKLLHHHIVSDIRVCNRRTKNQKLNKTLQTFLAGMLNDDSEVASCKALEVMSELYRRHVWNDGKTVNIICQGCFSKHTKVVVASIKFFLNSATGAGGEEEEEARPDTVAEAYRKHSTRAGKTKKRKRKLAEAVKKAQKEAGRPRATKTNWKAIELIHDPQGFAEKLVSALKKSKNRFEVKIMMMSLVSQTILSHELLVFNFYSYVQRYLRPHQKHVTVILALVASSVHPLVPPEDLEPVVRCLADSFVSDRCTPQAMAAGLNAIREICARQPLAMNKPLLTDLVQYKKYKDKGVMMAARSLLQLYREKDPSMLRARDRGRGNDARIPAKEYGETDGPAEVIWSSEEDDDDGLDDGKKEDASLDDVVAKDDDRSNEAVEPKDGMGVDALKEDTKDEGDADGLWFTDRSGDDTDRSTTDDLNALKEGSDGVEVEDSGDDDGDADDDDKSTLVGVEDRFRIPGAPLSQTDPHSATSAKDHDVGEVLQEDIEGWAKKRKMAREERIAHARASRDPTQFGHRDKRQYSGTTNREKDKLQPFAFKKYSRDVQQKRAKRKGSKRKSRKKAKQW